MDEDIYTATRQLQVSTLDGQVAYLDNLSQHFKSDEFSDVTLVVGWKKFPAHKAILATASSYFQRMFYGGAWREGAGEEVELQEEPDCEEEFEMFLRYFYSGSVDVTRETVKPIVTLADKYDVEGLREICSSYVVNLLTEKPDYELALDLLAFAEHMRLYDLQERCFDLICFNFEKACSHESWCTLPLEMIIAIIKRPEVVVSDEYVVYQAVQEWLLGKVETDVPLSDATQREIDIVCSILPYIQFKNMTVEQMCRVESNPLETHNRCKTDHLIHPYLFEAFRYVAVKDHCPDGTNEPAKFQRCYTGAPGLTTVTFDDADGCAHVTPDCTWSTEPSKYQWELVKPDGSSKYQIRLPRVSRYDFGSRTIHLRSALPGTIRLIVTFVFRNQDGLNLFALKDSFEARIPAESGTLVEFMEFRGDSRGCFPHDVMFKFEIEQV